MKYIITENQYKLISESHFSIWVRRRNNPKVMRTFFEESLQEFNFDLICEDFADEYDFADSVLDDAVDNFFAEYTNETGFDWIDNPDYSDIFEDIRTLYRDTFGPEVLDIYKENCPEDEDF